MAAGPVRRPGGSHAATYTAHAPGRRGGRPGPRVRPVAAPAVGRLRPRRRVPPPAGERGPAPGGLRGGVGTPRVRPGRGGAPGVGAFRPVDALSPGPVP